MNISVTGLLVITTGNINSLPIEKPWGLVILGVVALMVLVVSLMIFITVQDIWKNETGVFRIAFLFLFGVVAIAVIAAAICVTVIAIRGYL